MQLKLRRSQREGGVISKTAIFCLDARADLTDHERRDLARYKLYDQVIYNSEAAKRHLDKSEALNNTGTATGLLKGVVHLALARMRLNITIKSLERGHHIECKSLEELLAAEEAIMEACQNLRLFLDVAGTFDGSEVVIDFSTGTPQAVAQAHRPEPILAPPVETVVTPAPAPAIALESPVPPPPEESNEIQPLKYEEEEERPAPFDRVVRWVAGVTRSEEEAVRVILIGLGVVIAVILFGKLFVV